MGLGKLLNNKTHPHPELWSDMDRILSSGDLQEEFIIRIPILPLGTICLLADGCKRYRKNGRCSRNRGGGRLMAEEGQEEGGDCEIKICGVQLDNENRPGECREISFDESTGEDDRGPIEECELGKASCCPTPASLPEGTDPESCPTVFCEVGGPFETEEDKQNYKRQCEARGWKFHPHCKFSGWWSQCCGEEGTRCNRTASGGCCPTEGEGGASSDNNGGNEVCDGPPWEAEQVELASGEIARCAKKEEYCPSTSNSTNSANTANTANTANNANQANVANSANVANQGGLSNIRGSPFQNLSNIRNIPIRNFWGFKNRQGGNDDCWFRLAFKKRVDLRSERRVLKRFKHRIIKERGYRRSGISRFLTRTMPCPTPVVTIE